MLEKINQTAEKLATNASRRQFFGRLGRGAMTVAAAVGGLLAMPSGAQAAPKFCGTNSSVECVGQRQGARCVVFDRGGRPIAGNCRGAPNCHCETRGR